MDLQNSQAQKVIRAATVSIADFLGAMAAESAANGQNLATGILRDPDIPNGYSPAMLFPDGSMILLQPTVVEAASFTTEREDDSPVIIFKDPYDVMEMDEIAQVREMVNGHDHAITSEYPE